MVLRVLCWPFKSKWLFGKLPHTALWLRLYFVRTHSVHRRFRIPGRLLDIDVQSVESNDYNRWIIIKWSLFETYPLQFVVDPLCQWIIFWVILCFDPTTDPTIRSNRLRVPCVLESCVSQYFSTRKIGQRSFESTWKRSFSSDCPQYGLAYKFNPL